jgi:L-fuconolactonase
MICSKPIMIAIDAHQHFWSPDRGDYGWMDSSDDYAPLRRDCLPQHLAPLLASLGIDRTVLVQAAPTIAETAFLLDLANVHQMIAAVVGWIDFEDKSHIRHLERFRRNPKFVGVRPMIQDIPDIDWMLSPELDWAFKAIIALDLTFDALGFPVHMDNFCRLFNRHPALRVVVDHGLKPAIRRPETADAWRSGIARVAAETSACCKLSGLATEAGPAWNPDLLRPYVDHLLACFGPDRLMWGSDWPVLELVSSYERWYAAARDLVAATGATDRIFGGTASSFYRLDALRSRP